MLLGVTPTAAPTYPPPPQELDRAVSKYEIIGVKAQATASKKNKPGSMAAQERTAARALTDLQRQLRDTEREAAALQERLVGLAEARQRLAATQVGRQHRVWRDVDVVVLVGGAQGTLGSWEGRGDIPEARRLELTRGFEDSELPPTKHSTLMAAHTPHTR